MKYLSKRIVNILLALFVIIAAGNLIAADVDTSQGHGKLEIADYLPQANRQTAADSMLLARLGSISSSPVALACTISANCNSGNPICCQGTCAKTCSVTPTHY